jgi:predicted transcriptional regulator
MIRGYVRVHPGTHYSAIKSGLDLPNGTLMYHLHTLEKQEIIHSKRDGRYKRFYPYGMKSSEKPILTEFQADILDTINETPGISKAEISYLFDRNRQDVHHNVNVLVNKDLVKVKKVGGKAYLYIKDGHMDEEEKEGFSKISRKHEKELEEMGPSKDSTKPKQMKEIGEMQNSNNKQNNNGGN